MNIGLIDTVTTELEGIKAEYKRLEHLKKMAMECKLKYLFSRWRDNSNKPDWQAVSFGNVSENTLANVHWDHHTGKRGDELEGVLAQHFTEINTVIIDCIEEDIKNLETKANNILKELLNGKV